MNELEETLRMRRVVRAAVHRTARFFLLCVVVPFLVGLGLMSALERLRERPARVAAPATLSRVGASDELEESTALERERDRATSLFLAVDAGFCSGE